MTEWGRTGDDEPRVSGSKADGSLMTEIVGDRRPVPLRLAITSLVRCVVRTLALLSRGEISQPNDRVGQVLRFDDRSGGRVYRETASRTRQSMRRQCWWWGSAFDGCEGGGMRSFEPRVC
jgi:hypothetical protein